MDFKDYAVNVVPSSIEIPFTCKTSSRSKAISYPETFSRRDLIPPVMNQGKIGSCVGCSGYIVVNDTKIINNDYPSALWIYHNGKRYDAFTGENYSGTTVYGAAEGVRQTGCCTNTEVPYEQTEQFVFTTELIELAAERKIDSISRIDINDVNAVKGALQTNSLWMSFAINSEFYNISSDGIINSDKYLNSSFIGGHAVAIIGWKTIEGKLYWECRNSWGTSFGDNGNFYIEHYVLTKFIYDSGVYALNYKETVEEEADAQVTKKKSSLLRNIVGLIGKIIKKIGTIFKR